MKGLYIAPLVAIVLVLRVVLYRRRRRRAAGEQRPARGAGLGPFTSDVGLVAAREIRERLRGRIFRVGTILILAVVGAAILIPKLTSSPASPEQVGLVGAFPSYARQAVSTTSKLVDSAVHFVHESDEAKARADLRSGRLDVALIDGRDILVYQSISPNDSSDSAQFATTLAGELGVDEAVAAAHLSPAQAAVLARAKTLPIHSLERGKQKAPVHATSVIGVILIFIMLTQYNTWILIGVMEEKSSRVIEVLLAAVRPMQLLAGKVLGIGLVAFGQASLIVAFALLLSSAVGSDLVHGTGPLTAVTTLVWLVLGYAFYCWVYAAAGSMAERQDQVQSLAFPLSLPIIFGYIVSLTAVTSGSAPSYFKVLAYLPPTAPFAMPVLVGMSDVSVWGFLASVGISIVATVGMARLATGIYRRAILRTGRKVRVREVLSRA